MVWLGFLNDAGANTTHTHMQTHTLHAACFPLVWLNSGAFTCQGFKIILVLASIFWKINILNDWLVFLSFFFAGQNKSVICDSAGGSSLCWVMVNQLITCLTILCWIRTLQSLWREAVSLIRCFESFFNLFIFIFFTFLKNLNSWSQSTKRKVHNWKSQ